MNARPIALLASIFTLCATEFLQSGMIAFSSAPIMGEIGAAPEEFSMIAALYACVAVITIAKQQWLMERIGWRVYLGGSCLIFVGGAMMCAHGDRILPFAIGRVIMALGGGGLMATARLLVNFQAPGPSRFLGIKVFASGLGSGMALAPLLASWAIVSADRSLIFYMLSAAMVLGTLLAMSAVPQYVRPEQYSSQSGTRRLLFLAASSFFLLYLLQRTYYDFYSDSLILTCFLILALFGLYAYFHIEHGHSAPLIRVKEVLSRRYVIGMSIFFTGYVLLGANNYAIPVFMQRGLGYSWETTGELQAFGLASSVVTWLIMSAILPRSPGLKKYLATGLTCLILFAWQMRRLSPSADLYTTVLPALMLYGSFIILTLATAAMQTFRDMLRADGLFVHGYQLKAMLAQIAVAIGTTVSTILIQWRSTVQYDHLSVHITQGGALFRENVTQLAALLGQRGDAAISVRQATAIIAGEVAQQATLLAGLEFFTVVGTVGIVALLTLACYHFLSGRSSTKTS